MWPSCVACKYHSDQCTSRIIISGQNHRLFILQQMNTTAHTSHSLEPTRFPLVAVVILNWNGRRYLEQFLPSVVSSTYPNLKIIVGDNASTDDSISFVRQNYPAVEIIRNEINEGFAKGYNLILERVEADFFVLLNSDVEVTPGWLEPIIMLMMADMNIAACQPKILQYAHRTTFEYAGAAGGWIDAAGYPFARGRIFETCETDNGQYDDAQPCFWASGAAMVVRADLYKKLGGLDEFFFAHQEEIDFCWRLQNAGYSVFVQPASVVYHVGGGTLPKASSRKTFLNFRNNLVMLAKNLSFGRKLYIIPLRIGLDAIAAWRELFSGNSSQFIAIAKAHFHFFGWCFSGRKNNSPTSNKKNKLTGKYRGLIILDHFVKKRNRFSEIVQS